ncbi:helix-turn-helix transcriptional regulator [Dactylosporangium sp. NPDC000555]|uniref:helix-turn-helix transcriptional regulator n=1 Tax=Dactylosporangium sp. NPDC000555 TaxID=3154260 RepID=UPI0033189829
MPEAPTDEPAASAAGSAVVGRASVPAAAWPPAELLTVAVDALRNPGLVVIAGAPGTGRTSVLKRLGESFRGQVFSGGALAMLRGVPALPLSRAVRVRLPSHEAPLLAEAVRSRVRHGLLLVDDLQWADPLTMAALPAIAEHCRIVVTLRTPHRLPGDAERALRTAAASAGAWLSMPPMPPDAAAALVRQLAPSASTAVVADLVRRAGGVPLAVTALAKHVAQGGTPRDGGDGLDKGLAYTVAGALADLTRPARTAMAALGLLGRPVTATVLGEGLTELVETGLVELAEGVAAPVSPYTAEVAAGLLDTAERAALHRRLATLVPPREAARHLAAAGAAAEAYRVAVSAAATAESSGDRAELLLLACDLPGVDAEPEVRVAAARAALAAGRPGSCLRVIDPATTDPVGAVLRGEALLQQGSPVAAAAAVAAVPDDAPAEIVGGRDRIRLLSMLTTDPGGALARAGELLAVHGDTPAHAGLRAAIAAVRAGTRQPGWEYGLASAASAAGQAGDALAARWSAWLLVETLTADARLAEAAQAAAAAAAACAGDLAYSWQTRFLAAQLWCDALRGEEIDEVVRRAGDLADRTLPALARGYAVAAASLAEADGGLLAPARARLEALQNRPASAGPVLDWVTREAAWLDGRPDQAYDPARDLDAAASSPLVDGLRRITARWAAYDAGVAASGFEDSAGADGSDGSADAAASAALPLAPVRATLEAWKAPDRFAEAAAAWRELARREEVRCLLAQGLLEDGAQLAVPPLLQAERLAEEAGLVVLLGRARRALRRHSIRRDTRGRRAGDELTDRERDVLRLVANGEPTRRIAGQLGISRETVETHIRSGMRKLGARTRTEAAALAIEELG